MLTYKIECYFPRGYIADPYWPAREKVINIQKSSGLNRARSEAARRKALEEFLRSKEMKLDEYLELEKQAARPFYTNGTGIVIPELHVMSFLVATISEARAAMRPCEPEQVRSRFLVSEWTTGKQTADGIFSRFVIVHLGTGQKASNQRGLRENPYICDFTGRGTISIDENFIDPATLQSAIDWGGKFVGIGASRKMGWGRFDLKKFEQ